MKTKMLTDHNGAYGTFSGFLSVEGHQLEIDTRKTHKSACEQSAKLLRNMADKFNALALK